MMKVQLYNSEQLKGAGPTLFDEHGKIVKTLPDGWTVGYTSSEQDSTVAQFTPDAPNSLKGRITTKGDDVGVVTFTADIRKPDGTQILDDDGGPVQLEVTVIGGTPQTSKFTAGESAGEEPGE